MWDLGAPERDPFEVLVLEGLKFRVWGSGFRRVQGLGFRFRV